MTRTPRRRGRRWAGRPSSAAACTVFRWDLDKTYLKTEFDRVFDLVRIPFERGRDKVAAPGVATLIRALRHAARADRRDVRVYFLTASPPQIGRAIREKLDLDGIEYDGIAFKNQLKHLVRGQFRNLREQVGFKLSELLKGHREGPADAREVLFGDDWESDPLLYSLFADILAGRVQQGELRDVLAAIGVDPDLVDEIVTLAADIAPRDVVGRIYINLERRTPPANFHWFGARLIPTFNYFQTAACLYGDGLLDIAGVVAVGRALVEQSGYSSQRLANSLADVVRRGHVPPAVGVDLASELAAQELMPPRAQARRMRRALLWERLVAWINGAEPAAAPVSPQPIDYRALVAEWRPAR